MRTLRARERVIAAASACIAPVIAMGVGVPALVVLTLAWLLALLACVRAGRAHGGTLAGGWQLLALGCGGWGARFALALADTTGHSWLPAWYRWPLAVTAEAALFAGVTAILTFTERGAPMTRRLRMADASLLATAAFFVVVVVGGATDAPSKHSGAWPVAAVATAVAVVVAALYLTARLHAEPRVGWWAMTTSHVSQLAAVAVTASFVPLMSGAGGARFEEWCSVVAAGCGAAGAILVRPQRSPHPTPETHPANTPVWRDLRVPIVTLLIMAIAGFVGAVLGGPLPPLCLVPLVASGGLLAARQGFIRVDHLQLTQRLERRVRERTEELRLRERRFRSLVTNASDVVTLVDVRGVIRYQSDSVERVLGYPPAALLGKRAADMVAPDQRDAVDGRLADPPAADDVETIELQLLRADGTLCLTETTMCNLLHEPSVEGILLTSRDVSDRRHLEDELRRQALVDPLTGLGNRTVLYDRLKSTIIRSGHNPCQLALLLLDLDAFKQVNDNLGHAAGDALLVEVARRLRDSVRPEDTVARMGGDEFAVLMESQHLDIPEISAQRIINRLRAPMDLGGLPFVISASVGIAHAWSADVSGEELMRRADLAMYAAKAKGRNRYQVFERSMQADARARLELASDLRRALTEGELCPFFQPLVDVRTGRIKGAEALVRWQHPDRGLVAPDLFVPVAEESDLILRIGRVMLNESCKAAVRFQQLFPADPPFTMSVNVATRQLASDFIVEDVANALAVSGLDPSSLILEITEGALMDPVSGGARNPSTTIEALKALGVKVAIDDFGTGWSSLSRLRSLPVDELKIDRAFVNEVDSSDEHSPLVDAIVAMGHSLRLEIVAEGVETLEQLRYLKRQGVETVQGYLLSRPLSAKKLEALLADPVSLVQGPGDVAVHYGVEPDDRKPRNPVDGERVEVVPLLIPEVEGGRLPGERRFRARGPMITPQRR